jgi:hypothetical protein
MTRRTLYRDAPGGHFPDCVVTEAGEVMLCHCPIDEVRSSRAPRILPRDSRVASKPAVARVAQHVPNGQHSSNHSIGCQLPPEPASFCSVLELDGDPPPSRLTVRAILLIAAFVVGMLLAAVTSGCATSRSWAPATATIALPHYAPPCAEWAASEAWAYLGSGVPVSIVRSSSAKPGAGVIVIDWRYPDDHPLTLAYVNTVGGRRITGATVRIKSCSLRLWMHELGHTRGLANVDEPNRLMTGLFPRGSYELTWRERRRLERR